MRPTVEIVSLTLHNKFSSLYWLISHGDYTPCITHISVDQWMNKK